MNIGRVLKRQLFTVVSTMLLYGGVAFAEEPLMINQILIDPKDPAIFYAAARPEGFLKSIDHGKSWSPARTGIKNTSGYHLVLDPTDPKILYLATFGGGVYKSMDGGERWVEVNDELGNTNIHAMAIDPKDPKHVVVGTSTGELFQSEDGAAHWAPFSQGLPSLEGEVIVTLLFDPADPAKLYLGQEGLYVRNSGQWVSLGDGLKKALITTLAIDPVEKVIYAGTKNEGMFLSRDEGKNWIPVAGAVNSGWVQKVMVGTSAAHEVYVSILGKGLFKSVDHGKTWKKLSGGLPEDDDIMSLAIDFRDAKQLYAGSHNKGMFVSSDGGKHWRVPEIRQEPVKEIIDSLVPDQPSPAKAAVDIPPAFLKCTKCHGWADVALTRKKTFWRVSPNRRDWQQTVARMAMGAGLMPGEEQTIIQFLTAYSRTRQP